MFKIGWRQNFLLYSISILAFTISLPFIYSTLSVILIAIAWIFQDNLKEKATSLKFKKQYFSWIAFFILHLISYTYSKNKSQSAFDIQSKLSFLVLPVLIGTGINLNSKSIEKIFLSYILGITTVAIFCISKAFYLYHLTGNKDYFFYHTLVKGLEANAIYVAWYTIFSLSILMFFNWQVYFKGTFRLFAVIIFLLQTVFFVLLSSKLLLALFFILIIPIYIAKQLIKKLKVWQLLIVFLLITGIGSVLFFTQNPISKRYTDILNNKDFDKAFLNNYQEQNVDFNNLTLRLFVWRVGFENMNEHHLWLTGAGNGDVLDLQNAKFAQHGIPNINNPVHRSNLYNVNLHNMYFQTLMMLGIPGLLVFLFMIITPFFYLKHTSHKKIFFIFFITSALFMLQESALQTQAGIIYFTFFTQIFWNLYYSEQKQEKSLFN